MNHDLVTSIREAFRAHVIDPEMRINIIDMGLVYGIFVEENRLKINMTFTSMGCPDAAEILKNAERVASEISGLPVHIEVVWEPAWNKSMLSAEAKYELMIP